MLQWSNHLVLPQGCVNLAILFVEYNLNTLKSGVPISPLFLTLNNLPNFCTKFSSLSTLDSLNTGEFLACYSVPSRKAHLWPLILCHFEALQQWLSNDIKDESCSIHEGLYIATFILGVLWSAHVHTRLAQCELLWHRAQHCRGSCAESAPGLEEVLAIPKKCGWSFI